MESLRKAEDFVFTLLKDTLSEAHTYHNFAHTARVVGAVREITANVPVSAQEQEALLLAAWFHDTGYTEGHEGHEEKGVAIFDRFALTAGIDPETAALVRSLIRVTEATAVPATIPEGILRDADCSHFADAEYYEISGLLREEWERFGIRTFTDIEWLQENRRLLLHRHRFYSDYARVNWQKRKERNVLVLQEKIRDAEKTANKRKKEETADRLPERGVETMFKVTLNNHTQLSQIADSKANILLSVNAIIISIALSTLVPKLDSAANTHLVIPTFVMMLFSVVSIIFAILSTRPKVTRGSFTRNEIDQKKINLLFFGNFYKMPLGEYQWAMNEMMKDREYLYNSMILDLYHLGLVLHRKYKLLRITYAVFMVGIIVSVAAFVIGLQSAMA